MAANDFRYTRRDPTNVANIILDAPTPVSSAIVMIDINGATALPKHALLGSRLTYNHVTMDVADLPISAITGLQTEIDDINSTMAQLSNVEGGLETWAAGMTSDVSALQIDMSGKVDKIVGKGLSTEDFTSAEKTNLGNQSGTNTGDQDLSGLALKTTTVNGHALSSNVTVTKSDVGLGNADNTSDVNKPISTATQSALDGKFAIPSGSTAQYVRGDGSLASFPSIPSLPIAVSNVTGLQTALDGKAALVHTHISTDITDTTSVGRSVMMAANVGAARTAIGAGTSSFSGAYADLTGKPTLATVAGTGNYYDLSTKPAAKSFNNAATPTIQTVAAGANGDRLSTFRDTEVSYSVTIDTSVSLSGNSSGYVVLEIAATNSTTASDWKEISRVSSGQAGSLVIGLVLNQTGGGAVVGVVPAGWYRRLRKVNVAGTPTIVLTGSQEVLDEPLQVAA